MSSSKAVTPDPVKEGFFESYKGYANTLRAWLIAYGVGLPALLLTHDPLVARVLASGQASLIATVFLVGVGSQVLGALLYKNAMWYLFIGHDRPGLSDTRRYRFADWLSEAFWLDCVFDLSSILLFVRGTYLFIGVLKP